MATRLRLNWKQCDQRRRQFCHIWAVFIKALGAFFVELIKSLALFVSSWVIESSGRTGCVKARNSQIDKLLPLWEQKSWSIQQSSLSACDDRSPTPSYKGRAVLVESGQAVDWMHLRWRQTINKSEINKLCFFRTEFPTLPRKVFGAHVFPQTTGWSLRLSSFTWDSSSWGGPWCRVSGSNPVKLLSERVKIKKNGSWHCCQAHHWSFWDAASWVATTRNCYKSSVPLFLWWSLPVNLGDPVKSSFKEHTINF